MAIRIFIMGILALVALRPVAFGQGVGRGADIRPPKLATVKRSPIGTKLSGTRRALLIGVDRYEKKADFPDLGYGEKDVADLAAVLRSNKWDVTCMVASDPDLNPTSPQLVLEKVRRMAADAESGDTLVVFLAGHGVNARAPRDRKSRDWFCLRPSRLIRQPGGTEAPRITGGVDIAELSRILNGSPAQKTILIADVCRTEPHRSVSDRGGLDLGRLEASQVHSLLFSTAPGARALEPPSGGLDHHNQAVRNSLFMHFFLKGLRGAANEKPDDFITLREVARFVHFELKDYNKAGGGHQVPVLFIVADAESDVLMVDAPADREGPKVTVSTPLDGALLQPGEIEFRGTVTDVAGPCRVTLEGRRAEVRGDQWMVRLNLRQPGAYELRLVAQDARSNRTQRKIAVSVITDEISPVRPITPVRPKPSSSGTGKAPAARSGARRKLSWAKPKAGTAWDEETGLPKEVIENRTGMELVLIPAGSYLRGAPKSEEGSEDDERPQHRVEITKAFYLGRYEVTQAEWKTVMGSNPARFKGDRRPVERVSWDDCIKYCTDSRAGFRLPTEAEWEYACRAGTTTPFHFGGTISSKQANYDGNYTYGGGRKGRYREKTIDVGSLNRPNAFGLHDMHGNVWEWCADSWDKSAYAKYRNGVQDPVEQDSGVSSRVLRGGSWGNDPRYCRSAFRNSLDRSNSNDCVGFRVARTP